MKRFACFVISLILLMMCACSQTAEPRDRTTLSPNFYAESVNNTPEHTETPIATESVESSLAEKAYFEMLNLEFDDLKEEALGLYSYKGIILRPEDIFEYPEFGYSGVNQGALYSIIGKNLDMRLETDGFMYGNLSDIYFEILLGTSKPEKWEDFKPIAVNLHGFITENATEKEILDDFEKLDCVQGSFDYENRSYSFTIIDLSRAAENLGITQEMLGYIFAYLSEYPFDIEFDGNSAIISINVQTYSFDEDYSEERDSLSTENIEQIEGGRITGGGTFTTYSFGEDGTVTKTTGTDTVTMGERNALSMAKEYLSSIPFSYSGLVEQLEFEGFSHDEAVYGVDNCGADWNEQAAKMASDYLDSMAFSRSGLIEQLQFEGFSYDQAVYGVEANGY